MPTHAIFLDESGDHGLRSIDHQFPVFVLAGVIFEVGHYTLFRRSLDGLKNKYWRRPDVHIHSYDIRKCQGDFAILLDQSIKDAFYADMSNLITRTPFWVIAITIDKPQFLQRYGLSRDVYATSMSWIMERVVFFLDSRPGNCSIRYVFEKRGKREDANLLKEFNNIKDRGTRFVNSARIQSTLNGIQFNTKAHNIAGLQLADLVSYPIARYHINPMRSNPAFNLIYPSKFYKGHNNVYGYKVFP